MGQMGAALAAVGVGPGADGEGTALGAGLHNGDVQPGDEAPVVAGEGDAHRPAAGPEVRHLRQPPAVAGGGLGPAQAVHHVLGGDGAAVAEGDAASQGDGVGIPGGVVGVGLRQGGLGVKGPVQGEQPLIQQGPQGLHGPVGAGDGVRRLPLEIGQGEGGELHVLLLLLHVVIVRQGAENVFRVRRRPVAPGQRRQAQGQKRREYALFHGIPRFHRQIMAI